jgi:hypothetical protein
MELAMGKRLFSFGNDWERSRKRVETNTKGLSEDQYQRAVCRVPLGLSAVSAT